MKARYPLIFSLIILIFLFSGLSQRLMLSLERELQEIECEKTSFQSACLYLSYQFRHLSALNYRLKSSALDNKTLPRIELFIKKGALEKIYEKRKKTLANSEPILFTDKSDWVKAKVRFSDGITTTQSKVKLRLKGDWGDHLRDPGKLSFRIKILDDNYFRGMKTFSIQHPSTRNYSAEPLLFDEMKRVGLLSPRYFFVDVKINGSNIGVMALEEHFRKELIESQFRREGPILALDESPIWEQRHQNLNVDKINREKDGVHPHTSNFGESDLLVKQFDQKKLKIGTTSTSQSIQSMSLLNDFFRGQISAEKVFDGETYARWFVLTNIWGACHGTIFHNKRYYFNPIIRKFEPLSFDNYPLPDSYTYCEDTVVDALLGNNAFIKNIESEILFFKKRYGSLDVVNNLIAEQQSILKILELDKTLNPKKIDPNKLLSNLSLFEKDIISRISSDHSAFYPTDTVTGQSLISLNKTLVRDVRSTILVDRNKTTLEVKNVSNYPITLNKLEIAHGNGEKKLVSIDLNKSIIKSFRSKNDYIFIRDIYDISIYDKPSIVLHYTNSNGTYRKDEAKIQFYNYDPKDVLVDPSDLPDTWKGAVSDVDIKTISITGGNYAFSTMWQLPLGWSLLIEKGVVLKFYGGGIIVNGGRLNINGTSNEPVLIHIEPDENVGDAGSYGGVTVLNSKSTSNISNLMVISESKVRLKNRQDFYGNTGCFNFYKSDVKIVDLTMQGMHCEDALNIVRSKFDIERLKIDGAYADCFDLDFSNGKIINSIFKNCGNDGVDVSGTTIDIVDTDFHSMGDKAISVGEGSTANVKLVHISDALIGVASKDKSSATIHESSFNNITSAALNAYVKKKEYGSSNIKCIDCEFQNISEVIKTRDGSLVTVLSTEK